ncbi:MAG: hypothetical protein AB7E72_13425 [Lysobacterales bacterium]
MDDEQWLLGAKGYFGGYRFSDGLAVPRFASVVRALVRDGTFVRAIKSSVMFYKGLDERSDSPLVRFRSPDHYLKRFGFKVEQLVLSGFRAKSEFASLPKRTPSEHRIHYEAIATAAEALRNMVESDQILCDEERAIKEMKSLSEFALELARDPPLQRPHVANADVVYVAKNVVASFRSHLHRPFPAAAASLVNAIFLGHTPEVTVDATYIQSLARKIDPKYFL